jgi:hypothetical protein
LRTSDYENHSYTLPQSPSLDLRNEIYNELTLWSDWSIFNTKLNSNNCQIKWNWATIDLINNGEYTVVIPVTNSNNAISLYIMYSTIDDHSHFQLVTINEIVEVTENFTNIDVEEKYIPFIVKIAIYDYYFYNRSDRNIANWFQLYFTINDSKIQPRTSFGYYWVSSEVINGLWDSYKVSSKVFFKIPCPIDGQGPTGGIRVLTEEDDWFINTGRSELDEDTDLTFDDGVLDQFKDCLQKHASASIISLLANGIKLTCNDLSESDIINALEKLCAESENNPSFSALEGLNSPGYSFGKEQFFAEIGSNDIIIEEVSFTSCAKVKCVYDLLDNNNNGLFCSTFGVLFDSDQFNLTLSVVPRNTIYSYGDAETSFDNNNITINIAEDFCNSSSHPLEIAGTLLHEAIHASMYQEALTQNPSLNSSDYCSIWQSYFATVDPCHEVMANQYVNHLAQAISDLDDNRFSLDHYLYIAWTGLGPIGNQLGLVTSPYLSQYYQQYQTLINSEFNACN